MKVKIEKTIREDVEIDDKYATVLEKSINDEMDTLTDEEEELWDELMDIVESNEWYTGFTADEDESIIWEL